MAKVRRRQTSPMSVGQINRLIRKSNKRSGLPEEGCLTRMRFFTPDRCYYDGQPTPVGIFPAYKAYLKALKGTLPSTFIRTATELYLHDAEFVDVRFDLKTGQLRLLLKAWHIGQSKPRRVRLDYTDAAIQPDTKALLRRLTGRKRKGEIIAHEGDVSPSGLCEHRLLCFPHGELVIRCSDCSYTWID